jgi:ribosomal protein L9
VYYSASVEPIEPEMEIFPELTAEDAIDYVKENEPDMREIYLYEIKLIGKYKVNYNLEKIM